MGLVVSFGDKMSTAEELSVCPWSSDDDRTWYVAQTKPRQEARVLRHVALRQVGVTPFLPKIEVIRHGNGRRAVSIEPLFPSYIFVRCHPMPETWSIVRWTPGVRRLLGDSEQPIAVPDALVRSIRERVEPLGFVRVGFGLPPGARVRVKTGAFAGLEGIFERPTTRRDRVRILLEILGTVAPLEIDVFDLEKV